MTTELRSITTLYEGDYVAWTERMAQLMRERKFDQVDWDNVIEEIASLGKTEKQALESNLIILLVHLLKWQYQPSMHCANWKGSIVEHRRRIRKALKNSPSLKPYLETQLNECYQDALEQAIAETALAAEQFPQLLPYPLPDILSPSFLPKL
ncbi:MAG: DUF29 domain-containing protein [Aphanocapsa sp. GSE-SYN-MK-11-07L]|jgi:hypothetical protein|nr:DUF29 domain-containing protein [Aphanocapsa sp. GSE-SYN-MK-11-07L]